MLIAHSPRMSSITLEKPFPFPGRTAGLRLALFERGVLEREVDIRFYLVCRLPAGHLAGEAALPFVISVQDLASWLHFTATAASPRSKSWVSCDCQTFRPLIPCYPMAQLRTIINPGRVDISLIRCVGAARKQDLRCLLRNVKKSLGNHCSGRGLAQCYNAELVDGCDGAAHGKHKR